MVSTVRRLHAPRRRQVTEGLKIRVRTKEKHRSVCAHAVPSPRVMAPGLVLNPIVDPAGCPRAGGEPRAAVGDLGNHDGVTRAIHDLSQSKTSVETDHSSNVTGTIGQIGTRYGDIGSLGVSLCG